MPEKFPDIPAFGKPREPFQEGKWPGLSQFKNDDRFVIREASLENINKYVSEKDKVASVPEAGLLVKRLFVELNTKYKLAVPAHLVVTKNPADVDSLYVITDKISDGTSKPESFSPEERRRYYEECTNICETHITYYADKYASGDYFLYDLRIYGARNNQYVFGRRAGEEYRHMYLVDTDPWIHKENPLEILRCIELVFQDVERLEKETRTLHEEDLIARLVELRTKAETLSLRIRKEL